MKLITQKRIEMRLSCGWLCFAMTLLVAFAGTAMGQDKGWQHQTESFDWQFPLTRPHTGVPIANGRQGLLVWGQDNVLHITIAQQGFWDHRGGHPAGGGGTYTQLRPLLANQDESGIRAMFGAGAVQDGNTPKSFQQLGGGRLDITMPTGWSLQSAKLSLGTGLVTVMAKSPSGVAQQIEIRQAVGQDIALVKLPPTLSNRAVFRLIPAFYLCHGAMEARGISAPDTFKQEGKANQAGSIRGFIQRLPADSPLVILYKKKGNMVWISSRVDEIDQTASAKLLKEAKEKPLIDSLKKWWSTYWASVPVVRLPDPLLQEMVDYGLYMQAIITPPHGLAAGLQGPLMEDYQLPPWSNDYHWNINVQMMYWPALATGRYEHQKPLWAMLKKQLPMMQQNAKQFYGVDDALMLPHATDDRGQVSGTFWAGQIDAGCLAWMAQMAWQYYQYSGDTAMLREVAYPLLSGAFNGYRVMMQDTTIDGKRQMRLPISVSPEWRGSQLRAVGANASFQLAAVHSISRILPEAAAVLGLTIDQRWSEVDQLLPNYAVVNSVKMQEYDQYRHNRIGLFEGQDLIESHRHHSHLAGIYPFLTVDPKDTVGKNDEIVRNSIHNWQLKGAGAWTGWCVTWASMLYAHLGMSDAAVSWLHYWHLNFVNEGRGTLHDPNWAGISTRYRDDPARQVAAGKPNKEIMQLDARLGGLNAVLELLVQQKPTVLTLVPSIPRGWDHFSFRNVMVAGGFRVSGLVDKGRLSEVVIEATRASTITLENNIGSTLFYNDSLRTNQPSTITFKAALAGDMWYLRHKDQPRHYKLIDWHPRRPKRIVYP